MESIYCCVSLFRMAGYDENKISEILRNSRTVAVVGISDKAERDSFRVANYLRNNGFQIIPVNPVISEWEGLKTYPNLVSIPRDKKIDIVDIFRKSEAVPKIVEESLEIHPKVIWMQEGVINEEGARLAKENGILVVMDRCMMKEHSRHK